MISPLDILMIFFMISFIMILVTPSHLLSALLTLEVITMLLLFATLYPTAIGSLNTPSTLTLITLGASEASLGLAIMVSMILSHGSDKVNSMHLLPS